MGRCYTPAAERGLKGAGGTPGGVGAFFVGLAMAVGGAYLLTNQVTVSTGFWGFFGRQTFGLTLLPLLIGIGLLFFDGKSLWGAFLTVDPEEPPDLLRSHEPLQHAGDARPPVRRPGPPGPKPQTVGLSLAPSGWS